MVAATTRHSGHEHPRSRSAAVVNDIVAQLSALGCRNTGPRRLLVETGPVCRVLPGDRELRCRTSQPWHRNHLLCGICGVSADQRRCDAEDMLREAAAFYFCAHIIEIQYL